MELYTVKEVAKLLRTSTNTVYALIRTGSITALKLGRIKIPDYELDRWARANQGLDLSDPENVKAFKVEVGLG
jgi:excisionase family DNA binding protein